MTARTAKVGRRFWLRGHPEVRGERVRRGSTTVRGPYSSALIEEQPFGRVMYWHGQGEAVHRLPLPDGQPREFAELAACRAVAEATEQERSADAGLALHARGFGCICGSGKPPICRDEVGALRCSVECCHGEPVYNLHIAPACRAVAPTHSCACGWAGSKPVVKMSGVLCPECRTVIEPSQRLTIPCQVVVEGVG